jgi:hypothetical protein
VVATLIGAGYAELCRRHSSFTETSALSNR